MGGKIKSLTVKKKKKMKTNFCLERSQDAEMKKKFSDKKTIHPL